MSGVQDRIDRHHAHVGEKQRVAVGRGLLGGLRRDVAAAAAAVVDDDRLLERVGDLRRHRPDHHVGAAAGRERHDQRDRARRIAVLGEREAGKRRQQRAAEDAASGSAVGDHHRSPCSLLHLDAGVRTTLPRPLEVDRRSACRSPPACWCTSRTACAAAFCTTSGDCAALTNSSFSCFTMAGGVPSGATMPCQTSNLGAGIALPRPWSARRAGSASAWCAVQPSTRSLPAWTWPIGRHIGAEQHIDVAGGEVAAPPGPAPR